MYVWMSLFTVLLFYVLTPGIFLSLPKGGSKYMVAMVHALVFTLIFGLTQNAVWNYFYEGFGPTANPRNTAGPGPLPEP